MEQLIGEVSEEYGFKVVELETAIKHVNILTFLWEDGCFGPRVGDYMTAVIICSHCSLHNRNTCLKRF